MNVAKYAELLRNKLPTHITIHQSLVFMHDGAPCHRSKIAKQFFAENHIKILNWSGNSPDLNPVKNLWTKMKDLVSQKQPGSSSVIKEGWVKEIFGEYSKSLMCSMPRRLQAVIDASGGHTKY